MIGYSFISFGVRYKLLFNLLLFKILIYHDKELHTNIDKYCYFCVHLLLKMKFINNMMVKQWDHI